MTIIDSGDYNYRHRLMIGTATTGLVRIEWVRARYGQARPVNWIMSECMPLGFLVDEAQNIIVREFLDSDCSWLFLHEEDVILPANTLKRLNEYMAAGWPPVVSGLYFTKSEMSQPLIFRGRGNSYFSDWQPGDKVWADGVPTGCLLIARPLLDAMWDDAPTVQFRQQQTRQVFRTVSETVNVGTPDEHIVFQTSDLRWCDDVIAAGYLDDYDLPYPDWPFLVDTGLFCQHIGRDGRKYPQAVDMVPA